MLRFIAERLAYLGASAAVALTAAGLTELAAKVLGYATVAHLWSHRARPTPEHWLEIVRRNVPLAARLGPAERDRLLALMKVMLRDIRFEGCQGLAMTEEIRVTIAAHACLLLLNLRFPWYPRLREVLVYPEPFVPKTVDAAHPRERTPLLGEAWSSGTVVLSWQAVRETARDPTDGHNVALHEFAHALDSSGGVADGTPPLEPGDLAKWAYVLHRHYGRLLHLARAGTPSTLDHYGASNEAEFFAVATEAFFERPLRLRSEEQELYEALRAVYNQDPAALVLSSPLSAPTSRTADPAG